MIPLSTPENCPTVRANTFRPLINRSKSRGFTLVEILVVLGILCLLAALIFPAFSAVRESGRRSTCASNLRQIGVAFGAYLNDHNNRYPPPVNVSCTWVDAMFPYVKTAETFRCPNVPYGDYQPGCAASSAVFGSPPVFVAYNGSYDMVAPYFSAKTTTTEDGKSETIMDYGKTGFSALRYKFPSSTYLALDSAQHDFSFHSTGASINPGNKMITSAEDLEERGVTAHHRGGNNILFVDGHVKWLSTSDLLKCGPWRPDGRDTPPPVSP